MKKKINKIEQFAQWHIKQYIKIQKCHQQLHGLQSRFLACIAVLNYWRVLGAEKLQQSP